MEILIEYPQFLWHIHSARLLSHSFIYCYRWLFKQVDVSCSINFSKVHLAGVILSALDNCVYNSIIAKFFSLIFLNQRKYEISFWEQMLLDINPIKILYFFSIILFRSLCKYIFSHYRNMTWQFYYLNLYTYLSKFE